MDPTPEDSHNKPLEPDHIHQPTPTGNNLPETNLSQKKVELAKWWPVKLFFCAVLTTAILIGAAFALTGLLTTSCGEGWDGLGCAILGFYVAAAITLLLMVACGTIFIHRFIVKSWFTAFLTVVPAVIFVAVAGYSDSLSLIMPDGLGPAGRLLYAGGLSIIATTAVMLLDLLLLRLLNRTHWALRILACVILAGCFIKFLPPIANHYETKRYAAKQIHDTEQLPFKLYMPSYIPAGYRIYVSNFNSSEFGQAANYELEYLHGNNEPVDPLPYEVYQFAVPSYYNPPSDCGESSPDFDTLDHLPQSCVFVGHADSGCDVYYSNPSFTNVTGGYCKIGSTLIAIGTDTGGVRSGPDQNEMLKIFNSLKPTNATELQKLKPVPVNP